MRLALLTDNEFGIDVARIVTSSNRHEVILAAVDECVRDGIVRAAPGVRLVDDPHELLTDGGPDAVVVAASGASFLEAARQLASAGIPLIVAPDSSMGIAFVYELSLARDDSGIELRPALTRRYDPRVVELKRFIDDGRAGAPRVVRLTRRISDLTAADNDADTLSGAAVDAELLEDTALLQFLIGDFNQVTALRTGVTGDRFSEMSINLAGPNVPEASLRYHASTAADWELNVECQDGTATLSGSGSFDSLQLTMGNGAAEPDAEEPGFVRLLDGITADSPDEGVIRPPGWSDLIRAFEVVEATRISIRRRRTIDLFFEQTSERSQFKTQMAAIGCGVLTWTLLGAVGYLMVSSAFKLPDMLLRVGRIIWLLPMVIFIAMQFLLLITKPARADDAERE